MAELRRDVLSMRHAVKERKARLAAENRMTATPIVVSPDVPSTSVERGNERSEVGNNPNVTMASSGDATLAAPLLIVSVEAPLQMSAAVSVPSTALETDNDEAVTLIEMADAAKTTLTIAANRADSPARKAELTRIGEAFAKTRGLLTDEDRRENTLNGRPRAKRARAKKDAGSSSG